MRALLSVSDKEGIVEFARGLVDLGFELISTGGTLKAVQEAGIEVKEVSSVTGFPEMFEGRVKTLHPKIHGGILYRRDKSDHVKDARANGIAPIDLVCVNLYPFKATIEKTDDFETIIENIDIGGPTLVRAAAKNFADALIVTDKNDYRSVLDAIKTKSDSQEFRRDLMIKAYEHTAEYDMTIANYMNRRFHEGFGGKQFVAGTKVMNTRYGENPHQKGALYEYGGFYSEHFQALKGEASFNNLTDINSAVKIAAAFGERPAVSIIKHGNPCGYAMKDTLLDSYTEALRCDPLSAFGGVVAINGPVDVGLAKKLNEIFLEVVVAPSVSEEALQVFETKKRLKVFCTGGEHLVWPEDSHDFKRIDGGFVYQEADKVEEQEIDSAECKTSTSPSAQQLSDLKIANQVAALVKSNCVVYVKDGVMVAIGMGMTSRVDASICALRKAKEQGMDVEGAVLASEAFFPFRDSVDAAAAAGVKAIVQPGGSVKDEEVIAAANEHGITMLFTGRRHFLH